MTENKPHILVVDDELSMREVLELMLTKEGYKVTCAENGRTAVGLLEKDHYDLMLCDIKLGDISGLDVLHASKKCNEDTVVILISAYASTETAVEAMNAGAYDYVPKPFDKDELMQTVAKALDLKTVEHEKELLDDQLKENLHFGLLIGNSPAMNHIYKLILQVAKTKTNVLITGESGTGKELIAKSIHQESDRSDQPFVVINCGGIPETLMESELFGHKKGAFTGAYKSRIGRFETANGGTIFLDEIGEMSPALQVKLLRVLQERKFERVGDTKTIHVDIRVIAATNKNLTVAINKNKFREDLYYRLNVIPINVPPLKQRKSDIPLLIDFFMKKFQKGSNKKLTGFSPKAMDSLLDFSWPGNIRELENTIKRLTILCDNDTVQFDDLPEHIQQNSKIISTNEEDIIEDGKSFNKAVKDYEKRLILEALEKSNGIKSKAAKLLNINRTTLVEKIKKQNFK